MFEILEGWISFHIEVALWWIRGRVNCVKSWLLSSFINLYLYCNWLKAQNLIEIYWQVAHWLLWPESLTKTNQFKVCKKKAVVKIIWTLSLTLSLRVSDLIKSLFSLQYVNQIFTEGILFSSLCIVYRTMIYILKKNSQWFS